MTNSIKMTSLLNGFSEKFKALAGHWTAYAAIGSFILYFFGYFSLKNWLKVLGISPELLIFDDRYFYWGISFFMFAIRNVGILFFIFIGCIFVMLTPTALIHFFYKIFPKNIKEKFRNWGRNRWVSIGTKCSISIAVVLVAIFWGIGMYFLGKELVSLDDPLELFIGFIVYIFIIWSVPIALIYLINKIFHKIEIKLITIKKWLRDLWINSSPTTLFIIGIIWSIAMFFILGYQHELVRNGLLLETDFPDEMLLKYLLAEDFGYRELYISVIVTGSSIPILLFIAGKRKEKQTNLSRFLGGLWLFICFYCFYIYLLLLVFLKRVIISQK